MTYIYKFSKLYEPPQNYRHQKDDMKKAQHWEPTNIWRECMKFSRLTELAPGISAPLE